MPAAELHFVDIVELAALRGRAHELSALAAQRRTTLPAMGRASLSGEQTALCVRPERWLLLAPPGAAPGATAAAWHTACKGVGVAVDLSSALAVLRLADPAACEGLARGCRLDLDPQVFPVGQAAATIIAQVSVIVARLSDGMRLLTPATTARHFREWIGEHGP